MIRLELGELRAIVLREHIDLLVLGSAVAINVALHAPNRSGGGAGTPASAQRSQLLSFGQTAYDQHCWG